VASKTRIEHSGSVAHLVLDDPEEKLNTLGAAMIAELKDRLAALRADASVKAVVIRSAKGGGFLAGANLVELQAMSASPEAAEAGYRAALAGQALMNAVEDLGKPVVAAIHGPALGGGCELALACTARVAASEGARIGLPEVQLGILPGFGGTWRLPRLMGFAAALPAILSSTNFDGRRAWKAGLVDDVAPLQQLPAVAEALALDLAVPGAAAALRSARRGRRPFLNRLLDAGPLRRFVLMRARKEVLAKTKGRYPAPLRALELMGHRPADRDVYLEAEARALGVLLATEVSRNLVRLFFMGQDAKKQAKGVKGARLERVAVVGAGFMGSGIAIPLVTKAGLRTALKESNLEVLGRALKKVRDQLAKSVAKKRLAPAEAAASFNLLWPGAEAQDFRRCDLVIEAVPEVLELKHKVFAELEALVPETAVLASNTSTLPISDISAQAAHPERFVGMHFFSPAEIMPLVEIIPGRWTTPETLATVVDLALKMGKTPVVVGDSPGFLVNRILLPYLLEAMQLVAEGVPPRAVEASALDLGMPVGPLKLVGEVGIPVILHVLGILKRHFSDHLPAPAWLDRADFADAFARDAAGKVQVRHALISAWISKPDPGYPAADIQDRLFLAMLNEGARALAEGLAPDAGIVDLAMIYGTGFPPYTGGLLRLADARGLAACVARGEALSARAPWLKPPAALAARPSFY
jgi:3-hydroxyacyl-CoA dehydrogenase/enoyl-CoA hydratase/3-hydroxybutyryl-CoA epimerase